MPASAYSARPSALSKPVPGDDFEQSMKGLISEPVPAMPAAQSAGPQAAAAPAPAHDDFAAAMSDLTGAGAQPDNSQAPDQLTNVARDNGGPSWEGLKNKVITGLAANDEEKANYLRSKYGDGNVRVDKGAISFRHGTDDKWKKLDNDSFHAIGNFVLDQARNLLTEGVMLPAEVAGGGAGFVAGLETGPGAFATAAMGARAARVAAVPAANAVADKVAAAAGIPQDPNRSKLTENAVGMGAEALLPVIGGKVAKYIPGTEAYAAAKKAGQKEVVALSAQSREVAEAAQRLASEGHLIPINGDDIGVPGANVVLMGHQLNPQNPDLNALADQAKQLGKFINAQTSQAEGWSSALENNLQEIARRGGKGPVAPERLASVVTNAVGDIEKAEGEAIGKFRAKAQAKLGNQKLPIPDALGQQAAEIMRELGFSVTTVEEKIRRRASFQSGPAKDSVTTAIKYLPPDDLKKYVGKFGLTTTGEVRSFVNALDDFANSSSKGLTLAETERLTRAMGNLNKTAGRTGGEISARWGSLTGELRQFRRSVVEAGLSDDTEKKAFNSAMDDFGAIRGNIDTLRNVLKDDASAKAIVGNVFTGKENLPKIRALKSLVGESNPEVWSALKEEWINQQLIKNSTSSTTTPFRYDAKKFISSLDKQYGPEFMREVLDDGVGPGSQTIRNLLKVGQRLQETYKLPKADDMSEKMKQGAMNTVIGILGDIKFKAVNGVMSLVGTAKDKEHPLFELMTRDGIDKYVTAYPGRLTPEKKRTITQNLTDMLGQYRVMRRLKQGYGAASKTQQRMPFGRDKAQDTEE